MAKKRTDVEIVSLQVPINLRAKIRKVAIERSYKEGVQYTWSELAREVLIKEFGSVPL